MAMLGPGWRLAKMFQLKIVQVSATRMQTRTASKAPKNRLVHIDATEPGQPENSQPESSSQRLAKQRWVDNPRLF